MASDDLTAAVLEDAPAQHLIQCDPPDLTRGLCIRREDESIFDGKTDGEIDVRDSLRLEEVELPQLMTDEVLVAVMASAINYNTVWSALFRPLSTFRFLDTFADDEYEDTRHCTDRHILGSDGAGVVVRAGTAVRHWRVGDAVVIHGLYTDEQDPAVQKDGLLPRRQRVWGYETNFGGLAQYTIVKATQLLQKPAHLSWEEAACNCGCLAPAYRMLISPNGARVKVGDLVLIWGATGGLGAYGTQLAKAAGCHVVGVVGSNRKVGLAYELGCDLVINREAALDIHPDGLLSPQTRRWMGTEIRSRFGRDPDHVFEYVGKETFGASVFLAARGGTIVTCGSSTGYDHTYDNRILWMRVKRIIGSHVANYQEAAEAMRLLASGVIAPVLSEVYRLSDASEATRVVQKNDHVGKVGVLCLAPEEGLGVTDPRLRAAISEQLHFFRLFSRGSRSCCPPSQVAHYGE